MEIRLEHGAWLRPRLLGTDADRAVTVDGLLKSDDPHRPVALVDRLEPHPDGCRYRRIDARGAVTDWCRAPDEAYEPCSRRVIDGLRRLEGDAERTVHRDPEGAALGSFAAWCRAGAPRRSLRLKDAAIAADGTLWIELALGGEGPTRAPIDTVWLSLAPATAPVTRYATPI